MTQKFINPLSKFTTDTLQSLPYSTLTFSVDGSSTAKAVYADKSKTTSLGAIVTSDSAGIFPPIWLDGTYRAILKNAAGVTMTGWPIDSVGDAQNFTSFSAWDSTFTYDITTNSFVTGSDGNYYQSIQNPNFNKDPISQPAYWTRIYFLPTWNANVNYAVDVLVINNGLLYKSNATGINHAPPNLSFWDNVSFNASITGPFTASGAIESGSSITADSSLGFISKTLIAAAINKIWSFGSAPTTGINYFDTTLGIGSNSVIGVNFSSSTVNSCRFGVCSDGRIFGSALHNNASPVTGATNQFICSGTHTLTATAISNCSSVSVNTGSWQRVGNVVTFSGVVNLIITTSSTATSAKVSLPIPAGSTPHYAAGTAISATSGLAYSISGVLSQNDASNMTLSFYAPAGSGGTTHNFYYTCCYTIIA